MTDIDIQLRAACRTNDTAQALKLFASGADPFFNAGSAVVWSARNGNMVLLEAFESLLVGPETKLRTQILDACLPHPCFVALYKKWNKHLRDDQRLELVHAALKHKNETHAHFLLDNLPALTSCEQQEVLTRAADGNWSVFRRVADLLNAPQPLFGTVGLLVRHKQFDLLQSITPFVAWNKGHHYEISQAFMESAEVYGLIRPFIGDVVASCEIMLRWASGKDTKTFKKALKDVTDISVQTNILCELLRFNKNEFVQVLLDTTGYEALAEHLYKKDMPNASALQKAFEEQHNWHQHKILQSLTQEHSVAAPARGLKL